MSPEERRLMRSCEVFDGDESKDENYIYTHLSHNLYDGIVADRIRTKAEFLGVSNNSLYPPEVTQEKKKEFVCDECGKSFNYRVALEGHKRKHIKEKVLVK